MIDKKKPKLTKAQQVAMPENLRIKYSTLLAYINSVVTFRFTTLGFFLAAVALILEGKPSFGKYILLALITISLYIIELRNRFLKNELEVQAKQIEKIWGNSDDFKPSLTTIFGIVLNKKDINSEEDERILIKLFGIIILKPKITHSIALDILYFSILFYALYKCFFQQFLLICLYLFHWWGFLPSINF